MSPRTPEPSTPEARDPVQDPDVPAAEAADDAPQEENPGGTDALAGSPAARKPKNFLPAAKRLASLIRPHRVLFLLVVALSVISVVLTVLAPRVLGQAMDVIFSGFIGAKLPADVSLQDLIAQAQASGNANYADMLAKSGVVPGQGIDFTLLGQKILFVLGLYIVASTLMWVSGYLLNVMVMRIVYKLRADIETKLNNLPLSYFDTRQRGDLMSRVTNDVDNIQQALQQGFSQLVRSGLQIIGIAIMMFVVSWQLALLALVALPLSAIIVGTIGSRSQKRFQAQWKETGSLNGHIEETFSGLELVRIFGRSQEMIEEFDARNERLFKASFGAQFLSGSMMPLMQFVNYFTYVLVAVAGGLRVASGQLTLGDVTAFIQYSREFSQPLTQLGGLAQMLQSGVASAERTFELLDAEEQLPETVTAELPERTDGHVSFENVLFSYTPDAPLIEDLSFDVQPGQTIAIVGPTGAGKTTLVNLIMRFYELDAGRILLDGADITSLSRHAVRSRVGMVLQDAVLFEGTIRENIRYGRLDATDEEVVEAAQATMVDRFVRQLPAGYDTVVDADGDTVSTGERQLLTIARAFIANPSLLILDEATSSVDTRTELLVQHAMNALRTERTSFVIAHRLSTVREADMILMMADGKIVEQGNHDDLLEARGAYYDLYMSQFLGAAVDVDADSGLAPVGAGDPAVVGPAGGAPGEDPTAGGSAGAESAG